MLRKEFLRVLKNNKVITEHNQLGKKYKKVLINDVELLQKIVNFTSFLQYDAPISSRLYCIIKNIMYQPTCKTCNKPLKMRTTSKVRWTFGKFCGGACIGRNAKVRKKYKQTNLDRYGFENTFQVEKFKKGSKQTMIKS